jgi:hypothetical protein
MEVVVESLLVAMKPTNPIKGLQAWVVVEDPIEPFLVATKPHKVDYELKQWILEHNGNRS